MGNGSVSKTAVAIAGVPLRALTGNRDQLHTSDLPEGLDQRLTRGDGFSEEPMVWFEPSSAHWGLYC